MEIRKKIRYLKASGIKSFLNQASHTNDQENSDAALTSEDTSETKLFHHVYTGASDPKDEAAINFDQRLNQVFFFHFDF